MSEKPNDASNGDSKRHPLSREGKIEDKDAETLHGFFIRTFIECLSRLAHRR